MRINVLFSDITAVLETTLSGGSEILPTLFSDVQTISIPKDVYTGPTEVTPSGTTQILRTNGKGLFSDITINPIPSNYGLITWNGSTLTVS